MLIAVASIVLLPMMSFAKTKPIMITDILQHLKKGEPWDRSVFTAPKMVMFQQAASGGTDATSVAKITLSYFTSTDCTATNGTSVPTYTTPNGTSFAISVGTPFGMVAASAWNVGNSKVSPAVADMTTIQSIAVTLKSTNNNTPQASFTGISFACVPVTCSAGPIGQCTSGNGTQSFQLKTTAVVGDPADGGIIGCKNTGVSPNLFNLVVPASDNNSGTSIVWATNPGGSSTLLGSTAQSSTNGATNTTVIVNCLSNSSCPVGVTVPTQTAASNYAAGFCSLYSATGGFTSNWFLPAGGNVGGTQQDCLFTNRVAIATGAAVSGGSGFAATTYWGSTEASSTNAWRKNFSGGGTGNVSKTTTVLFRCSRVFTP
jgi:hypothetical protein